MTRKISTKKRFSASDFLYKNFLITLLINRVLKNGKKLLAQKIIYNCIKLIEVKTSGNGLLILEKAIRNASPRVKLKAKRIGGATYQVPQLLNRYHSTLYAICWLLHCARLRNGKMFITNLVNEIIDTSKNIGAVIKKKEETHRMAEANKAFLTI